MEVRVVQKFHVVACLVSKLHLQTRLKMFQLFRHAE
jgi:hypothetical protein